MFLALLLWQQLVALVSGNEITCSTSSGQRGQAGHVTCHFHTDAVTLKPVIVSVEHYATSSQDPVQVLECQWLDKLSCAISDQGYTFDGNITSQLRLTVTNTSEEFEGSYVCRALSPGMTDIVEPKACYFVMKGPQDKNEEKEDRLWILAVLFFAAVNLFGLYYFCFHRKCSKLCSRLCNKTSTTGAKSSETEETPAVLMSHNKLSSVPREDDIKPESTKLLNATGRNGAVQGTEVEESLEKAEASQHYSSRGSPADSESDTEGSLSDMEEEDKEEIRQRLGEQGFLRLAGGKVSRSELRECKKNLKQTGCMETLP